MRILHIVVGLDPALGGPPAVAARLAAAQSLGGHDVTLAAHDSPHRRAQVEQSIGAIPGIDRVKIIALDPRVRAGWFISGKAMGGLRAAIGETEIVHLHGLWEPLVRQAAIEAWRMGKPYILTPHGMLDPWSLRQRSLKKRIALMLVFRRVLQRAARLHLLNTDEVRLLEPLRLHTRTTVIPNGVFLDEIEPLPPSGTFRAAHPELGSDPYILFLGRLHYKKGLDHLAGAFAAMARQSPGVRLVVAGPDEGAQADFERRVRDAGVGGEGGRVQVVGPLWGRDKFAAMVDAACFCLPSRQEGFSMAITEAMACGLPVVISEACHFPEVEQVGAGEIVPLQDNAIAAALERVLTDAGAAKRMGAAGRRLVLERYVWPVIGERAVQAYAEALAERN